MCFSAEASFVSGTVLSVTGIVALKKTDSSALIPLAAIPLIFAIQQFTEGILWIALPHPEKHTLQQGAAFVFLLFAQVVWPSWVPFAVLMAETDERRKKILRLFLVIGATVSAYLLFRLLTSAVHAEISSHHIRYDIGTPSSITRYLGLMYFAATVAAPFFSEKRKMWLIGLAILVSYIITRIFYENYVISVWCFFAAIISGTILFLVWNEPAKKKV